jgi:pilus assembly protein Flp/PilA
MTLRILSVVLGSRRDERGASAVEYGLMVAGIAAVIVGTVFLFGQGIFTNLFQSTCDSINQNNGGCPG